MGGVTLTGMPEPFPVPIGLRLNQAARAVGRAFDEALAEAGGSLPVWLILLNLTARRPARSANWPRLSASARPTLTHHLNAMDADGLITRTRDAANRRVQVVTLTDKGGQAFLALRAAAIAFDTRLRTGLDDADLAALTTLARPPVGQRRRPRRDGPAVGRPGPPISHQCRAAAAAGVSVLPGEPLPMDRPASDTPSAAPMCDPVTHPGRRRTGRGARRRASGSRKAGERGDRGGRARGEQREVARGDDRGQDDRGLRAGDGRGRVDAEQHLLQVGVRGRRDLADHVRRPGDRVGLEHRGDRREVRLHRVERALGDRQGDEREHGEPGGGHVDLRAVTGDHPRLLHALEPRLHGGPGDPGDPGQFKRPGARVLPQRGNERQVQRVEFRHRGTSGHSVESTRQSGLVEYHIYSAKCSIRLGKDRAVD